MGSIDYKPQKGDIDKFYENLFEYIRTHREELDTYLPEPKHEEKFLDRLSKSIKKAMVSIVPHIVKAAIITTVVWVVTFVIWRIFLYPVSIITIIKSLIN
jgi:hypothetical protein